MKFSSEKCYIIDEFQTVSNTQSRDTCSILVRLVFRIWCLYCLQFPGSSPVFAYIYLSLLNFTSMAFPVQTQHIVGENQATGTIFIYPIKRNPKDGKSSLLPLPVYLWSRVNATAYVSAGWRPRRHISKRKSFKFVNTSIYV